MQHTTSEKPFKTHEIAYSHIADTHMRHIHTLLSLKAHGGLPRVTLTAWQLELF